jgi:hypothetical protein
MAERAVAHRGETAVAPVQDLAGGLLAVIERAARDSSVDIDKMERLLAMQERVQERQAKQAFTEAKIAMRPDLPEITMKGMIVIRKDGKVQQETPFARFEDLHQLVMPVLSAHGFDLKYKNGLSADGKVRVTTILSHIDGHEDETHFDLPHDSSGSKNPVQAVGSSTAYGKRYGTISILNLRVVGEDDDGVSATPATVVEKPADAPFPQGPAKNKTALKALARDFWRDVEASEDSGSLSELVKGAGPMLAQLKEALPSWWEGGNGPTGSYDGLGAVITKRQQELE